MPLTRDQARLLDRRATDDYAVPGVVLMENAGRAMADLLRSLHPTGLVLVCCGKGNNGGDGFVIARHLDRTHHRVRILLFANPAELAGDAAINYQVCVKSGLDLHVLPLDPLDEAGLLPHLSEAEWVVDALFGSGLQGSVRPPFDRVIAAVNASGKRTFAVDIPSGLDADSGQPLGVCVRADHTATVVAPKAGFAAAEAQRWLGQVHVVDMGAPRRLLEEFGC